MSYEAKILLDSVSLEGNRLTTFQITYPRFVHSELMTHRMFSRNSASSRAIPISKMIEQVRTNPVLPVEWGKNQKGMQALAALNEFDAHSAEKIWLDARDLAVQFAERLDFTKVHKQITNRLLEPWMWIEADFVLHERLLASRHLSPFEHVATPTPFAQDEANFRGWEQYRKRVEHGRSV